MSKALFILRHYNDIDHIAPVIHKWSRAGHDSAVILLGRANTVNDYRIKYISSLERVRLIPLTTLLTPRPNRAESNVQAFIERPSTSTPQAPH